MDLYYTPTCPACPKAKKIVRRVLKEYKDVKYRELNAFENQDKVMELGFNMVPTIVIDDEVWQSGVPDEEDLRSLLNKR